jgi:Lectin C-type domain
MSWPKAREECKKIGMELVSMETEEENNCVKKLLKDAGLHETKSQF